MRRQETDGLRVLLVGFREGQDMVEVSAAFQQALVEQRVAPLPIRVERVEAIPKAASGKAPLIKALPRDLVPQEAV